MNVNSAPTGDPELRKIQRRLPDRLLLRLGNLCALQLIPRAADRGNRVQQVIRFLRRHHEELAVTRYPQIGFKLSIILCNFLSSRLPEVSYVA